MLDVYDSIAKVTPLPFSRNSSSNSYSYSSSYSSTFVPIFISVPAKLKPFNSPELREAASFEDFPVKVKSPDPKINGQVRWLRRIQRPPAMNLENEKKDEGEKNDNDNDNDDDFDFYSDSEEEFVDLTVSETLKMTPSESPSRDSPASRTKYARKKKKRNNERRKARKKRIKSKENKGSDVNEDVDDINRMIAPNQVGKGKKKEKKNKLRRSERIKMMKEKEALLEKQERVIQVVVLVRWSLFWNEKGNVALQGTRNDISIRTTWKSHSVIERIDTLLIRTTNERCRLRGKMNVDKTMKNGFTRRVAERFVLGFPPNWKELLAIHLPPRKKNATNTFKAKHKSEMGALNRSGETSSLECTPSLANLNVDKLLRTRSGRLVVPRLAFWMNQYITNDKNGSMIVVDGTPADCVKMVLKKDTDLINTEKSQKEKKSYDEILNEYKNLLAKEPRVLLRRLENDPNETFQPFKDNNANILKRKDVEKKTMKANYESERNNRKRKADDQENSVAREITYSEGRKSKELKNVKRATTKTRSQRNKTSYVRDKAKSQAKKREQKNSTHKKETNESDTEITEQKKSRRNKEIENKRANIEDENDNENAQDDAIPAVTARPGTLTRTRQIKEFLQHGMKNYEADFFSSVRYKIGNFEKVQICDFDVESIASTVTNNQTPNSRIPLPTPASRHRTPEPELNFIRPLSDEVFKKKEVESYIHNRRKKGQGPVKSLRGKSAADSPNKNNCRLSGLTKLSFSDAEETDENEIDEDEQQDYYYYFDN